MRTPAGVECALYYQDFHRGLDVVECRAARSPQSMGWTATDCAKCTIPSILLANGSPDLELMLTVKRSFFGLGGRMFVEAYCQRHAIPIADPHVGCVRCAEEMFAGVDLDATAEGHEDV